LKLRRLQVRNFLSFGDEPVEMDFRDEAVSIIVGPNNSGKSNIFRTLNFVGESITRTQSTSEVSKYLPSETRDFEVSISIELNKAEHQSLLDFMVCSTLLYNPGGTYADQQSITLALNELLSKHSERLFGGIGKEIEVVVKGTRRDASPATHLYAVRWDQNEFVVLNGNLLLKEGIPESGGLSSVPLASLLFEKSKFNDPNNPQDAVQQLGSINDSFEPPNLPKVISEKLATNADPIRSVFTGVSVNPVNFWEFDQKIGAKQDFHRLRNFLGARGFYDNGITLDQFFALVYTSSIVWMTDLRGVPSDNVPIVWERPVEKTGLEVYGTTTRPKIRQITADDLAGWLFELSSAENIADQTKYLKIQEEFHRFTKLRFGVYLSEVEVIEEPKIALVRIPLGQPGSIQTDTDEIVAIGVPANKNRKMVKTAGIQISDGKRSWPVRFSSAGAVEVLCLLTGIIGTKDGILLLDEPVQNMHPEFQHLFLQLLDKYAKEDGNQAFVITHSPFLITKENLKNTWYVTKKDGTTVILSVMRKLAEEPGLAQGVTQQFDSSDVWSILFGKGAVFVEGPSDKWILEEVDRKAASAGRGPKLLENEWQIISMNTRDNTRVFLNLAEHLRLNYVFLLDRDAEPIVKKLLQAGGCRPLTEEAMRERGFFLLKSDLDDLFGITGGSKPRKALQRVRNMQFQEVPPQFMEFMTFLEERIRGNKGGSDQGPPQR
jgi:energy-coupling factor transporter ATP-binding protein EcfA2